MLLQAADQLLARSERSIGDQRVDTRQDGFVELDAL